MANLRETNCRSYQILVQERFEALASLPQNSVDCIWTDPPYFVSNGGVSFRHGQVASVDKGSWDRSSGVEGDMQFHEEWVRECHRVLKPNGTIWASGTHHAYLLFGYAMVRSGFRVLNDIIWQKPNPPPNISKRRFTFATEVIVWAAKASPNTRLGHQFDHEAMCEENGGRPMTNVWRLDTVRPHEKALGGHPTQKPVALVRRCLQASTQRGDLVLDPFMGSGTTGVAAIGLGRRFIGIERDDEFLALAQRRLESARRSHVP